MRFYKIQTRRDKIRNSVKNYIDAPRRKRREHFVLEQVGICSCE